MAISPERARSTKLPLSPPTTLEAEALIRDLENKEQRYNDVLDVRKKYWFFQKAWSWVRNPRYRNPLGVSEQERRNLESHLRNQINRASSIEELNAIYHAYINRVYLTQHRRYFQLGRTDAEKSFIAALQAKAKELSPLDGVSFSPGVFDKVASGAFSALKNIRFPGRKRKTSAEPLNSAPLSSPPASNGANINNSSSVGGGETAAYQNEAKSPIELTRDRQSQHLQNLLVRETTLKKAPYFSGKNKSWRGNTRNGAGGLSTTYTKGDKKVMRDQLQAEINAANSVEDIIRIYNQYAGTRFIGRRHAAFLESYSYSETKAFLVRELRKRAFEMHQQKTEMYRDAQGQNRDGQYNKIRVSATEEDEGIQGLSDDNVRSYLSDINKLLDHSLFLSTHEGRNFFGGVGTKEREALEESRKILAAEMGRRVNAERSSATFDSFVPRA
jgi:hypothetical protein